MQRKSSSSVDVKFFSLNYDEVIEKLRAYARRCIEKGAKAVILIGSLARGDYTAFSDADIVIVSDNVEPRPIDRIKEFIDPTLPIDIEPRVYTTQELLRMAKEKRKLVREIIEYGMLLAGDEEILKKLKESLEHVDTGL